MKFKEKRGSTFVFESHGEELKIIEAEKGFLFIFKDVWVDRSLSVRTLEYSLKYEDIQTAVNLMQILIKEGLV